MRYILIGSALILIAGYFAPTAGVYFLVASAGLGGLLIGMWLGRRYPQR